MEGQINRHTHRYTNTDNRTDRHNGQDSQRNRQTDRQKNGQTERETCLGKARRPRDNNQFQWNSIDPFWNKPSMVHGFQAGGMDRALAP